MNESNNPPRKPLRVSRSAAAMMAASRPNNQVSASLVCAILVVVLGAAAAWYWRAFWLPRVQELWAKAAPETPAAVDEPDDGDDWEEETPAAPEPTPPPASAYPAPPPPPPPPPPVVMVDSAVPAAQEIASSPDSPAALFNAALRDYRLFMEDKETRAGLLPSIEDRARRAAKGLEAALADATGDRRVKLDAALAQCYRLISDCHRQNLQRPEPSNTLDAPARSSHAAFNRATVGPKRRAALPAVGTAADPDSP